MFRFRLQRVLELRELSEQAKARELSSAKDTAEVARLEQESLSNLRANSRSKMDTSSSFGMHVGHLQQSGFVLQSLEERLLSATDALTAADSAVSIAESALVDAARARQALDRLKERHLGVWRADESQRDRLQMDELALSRHSKRVDSASNEQNEEQVSKKPGTGDAS